MIQHRFHVHHLNEDPLLGRNVEDLLFGFGFLELVLPATFEVTGVDQRQIRSLIDGTGR